MENVPPVIKTGHDLVDDETEFPSDLMKNIQATMLTLMEKAVISAASYAKASGSDNVSSTDMIYALQYQAHEFLNSHDLEERIIANRNTDKDIIIGEDETDEDETDEDFKRVPEGVNELTDKMNNYHDTWNQWNPNTYVEKSIKNAVDKVLETL
jgi:hypothetical protein